MRRWRTVAVAVRGSYTVTVAPGGVSLISAGGA